MTVPPPCRAPTLACSSSARIIAPEQPSACVAEQTGLEAEFVAGKADATRRLASTAFDLLCLELELRDGTGVSLLDELGDAALVPIRIAVSGTRDATVVSSAWRAGVEGVPSRTRQYISASRGRAPGDAASAATSFERTPAATTCSRAIRAIRRGRSGNADARSAIPRRESRYGCERNGGLASRGQEEAAACVLQAAGCSRSSRPRAMRKRMVPPSRKRRDAVTL